MLDEFVPSQQEQKTPSASLVPDKADASLELPEGVSDEEFAAQLQAGMKDLLGELDSSPDMQAQLESMLKEFGGHTAPEVSNDTGTPSAGPTINPAESSSREKSGSAAAAGEESFQETIKKTMERMKASDSSATATASTASEDDLLAEMMKLWLPLD